MTIKISLKIGGIVQLNQHNVLPVTLAVFDQKGQIEEIVSFLSPLPKTLEHSFSDWQRFIRLNGNRKVIRDRHNRSLGKANLTQLTNDLKVELNKWLGSDAWVNEYGEPDFRVNEILEHYREKIKDKDQIRIILQTEEPQLRGLPWQEWKTLEQYSREGVEVALSAINFRRLEQKRTSQIKASARILVIFGDEKLDFRKEKGFINNLKKHGGEPHILNQPTRKQLEEKLEDSQGWHILFFAGHSGSGQDLQDGWIQLKPAIIKEGVVIEEEELIKINDLTELLKDVIKNKLQLVIFNSCDGLGLANQLTQISLPYCIVMREEITSDVATELLEHFLNAFVKDKSLFTSMNIARNKLKRKFELGQSWLPVIVANPLAKELTWNSLFSERRLPWWGELLLGVMAIAMLISLPISIFSEFQGWESLALYAQLYPHLTVYPSAFLWIPLFASYKTHCMIRVKTIWFKVFTFITVFIVSGALFLELTGDRMMLFEFKSEAMTTINKTQLESLFLKWKTSKEAILNIPETIFDIHKAFDSQGNLTLKKSELEIAIRKLTASDRQNITGFQSLLQIVTSYDVWKQNVEVFSFTRWLYIINFIAILGCCMQIFALVSTLFFEPSSVFNKNRYLIYLIMCEFGIVLWFPFQNYSIEHTKNLLFSHEFRGTLAGYNVMLYVIILFLFLTTLTAININVTKKYQTVLVLFLLGTVSGVFLSSFFGANLINSVFFINSNAPFTPWLAGILVFVPLFILLVRWIDLHVGEEEI